MNYAARTNVGRRIKNEDSMYVPEEQTIPLLAIVADGMGGHAAGKRASSLAVAGIVQALHAKSAGNLGEDPVARLRAAIRSANRMVFEHAAQEEGCRGMGTTLALVYATEEQYIAANIGDSRVYHFDGWELSQVTQDHSLVAVLVRHGEITAAEANIHPQRNIITRAVGTSAHEEADYFQRRWNAGERLLICSDGLHGSLNDDILAEHLRMQLPLGDICERLIEAALHAGATDNITVVIVENAGGAPA